MPNPTNCIRFDRDRVTSARAASSGAHGRGRMGRARASAPPCPTPGADRLTGIFDDLSPAQYAFLSGVLAILTEHGEDALTKSCQMVIERFGRGHAG